jgi:hypothetical protein
MDAITRVLGSRMRRNFKKNCAKPVFGGVGVINGTRDTIAH